MTTVAIYSYEDRLGAHRHKVRSRSSSSPASQRTFELTLLSYFLTRPMKLTKSERA
jgi:hypothetical protein